MGKMSDKLGEVNVLIKRLQERYPAEINAFMSFVKKAESGPALSEREKELINIGLSVAGQCEWCIALHVQHAIQAGATRDEIVEAGFMAVVMHGGPALVCLTPLMKALDEFLPEEGA